jgi:hypothetical protein
MVRSLVATGVLLIVLGLGILGVLVSGRTDRYDSGQVPLVVEDLSRTSPPSRLWSVVGGLSLAAGAACIGLGVNRWRQVGSAERRA